VLATGVLASAFATITSVLARLIDVIRWHEPWDTGSTGDDLLLGDIR
jgi:hypothetical protein